MTEPKVARNKLIVIARQIGELTGDVDLSYRKIGEELEITRERVFEIYQENKDKYSIAKFIKPSLLSKVSKK